MSESAREARGGIFLEQKSGNYIQGAEIGKELIDAWNSMSADQQRKMKKEIIDVHHGEIGCLTKIFGHVLTLSENKTAKEFGEGLMGFGDTLIQDDVQDRKKWFKPR